MAFAPSSEKFGFSSDTTRKIDTLRKMALRLKGGKPLMDGDYLNDIADEMERVYGIMLSRAKMGVKGQDTGLVDCHGNNIHIGDKLSFDPVQWGGECNFVVGWEDGELTGYGTISDWSEWCELIGTEIPKIEKETAMQIRVYETVTQQPNGDRDTARHPCSAFEVVLVNGDRRTTIYRNTQFDHQWTSIKGTRKEYLKLAMDAAESLALTMGACEIVGVELTRREKEIMDLEASIKQDQARLAKLYMER